MSYRQFREAAERAGFKPEGALMYWRLAPPVDNISVCILNAGDRRRDRLAYLHQQQTLHEKRMAEGR
jgi:hypothetical protein